jgi:hypothetical protein
LNAIKRDITACEYGSARDFLKSADLKDLRAFREQKLLLKITDRESRADLANSYKFAALRLLGGSDQSRFEQGYADFAIIAKDALDLAASNTIAEMRNLPRISLRELVGTVDTLISNAFEEFSENSWNRVAPDLKRVNILPRESAALSSRTLHEIVGSTNDVLFACCRVLNEAARSIDRHKAFRSGRAVQDAARDTLSKLVTLCSTQNSIEYMVNMVSYGEWVVASISAGSPIEIAFNLADPALDYARTLAIRREIARTRTRVRNRPQTPRMSAEVLSQYLQPFVEKCLDYFAERGTPAGYRRSSEKLSQLYSSLMGTLAYLQRDDDLLLDSSGSPELLSQYLAALSLRWFVDICRFTAKECNNRQRAVFEAPTIHADQLAALMGCEFNLSIEVRVAIPHFCRTLPMTRYLDITEYPFFIESDGRILCSTAADAGRWPVTVRSKWLQGGYIGDRYGKIWESYIAHAFESHEWLVVGHGIRLRSEGKTLTDVDLLVVRDNLLLIIQIKALIGYGTDPYEQWKGRGVLSSGARQAKLAACFLRGNTKWMTGIFGAAITSRISDVQPLVITNINIFNGWINEEVPIVSVSGLHEILSGAKVVYAREDGHVVSEERMTEEGSITSEAFMDLIHNPLDWRLANESLRIVHTPLEFGAIRWKIPSSLGGWAIQSHSWGSDDDSSPQ